MLLIFFAIFLLIHYWNEKKWLGVVLCGIALILAIIAFVLS